MAVLARVTEVEHLGARTLRVVFSDGLVRELDFAGALPGVLATLDEDITFAGATVDSTAGTVCWPNGHKLRLLEGFDGQQGGGHLSQDRSVDVGHEVLPHASQGPTATSNVAVPPRLALPCAVERSCRLPAPSV